jgi:hypothetical protein
MDAKCFAAKQSTQYVLIKRNEMEENCILQNNLRAVESCVHLSSLMRVISYVRYDVGGLESYFVSE